MIKLKDDIAKTLKQFPKLTLFEREGGSPSLKGTIEIFNERSEIIDSFEVDIRFTSKFPREYPLVFETGGRFSRDNPELHFFTNESLCLNVIQEEIITTRQGISTIDFINNVLIPNLAWRVCKLEGLTTELKEYRHGLNGVIDSYKEKLNVSSNIQMVKFLGLYLLNKLPERNKPCFCGSTINFKKCHYRYLDYLKQIDSKLIRQHLLDILSDIK